MLDIKYVREHLDEVAETMKNRHASFDPEQFTALDVQRREVIAEEEALQAERNKLSKEIGALMGQGKTDEANATKETVRQINEKLTALGDARAEAEAAMDALMLSIPNMVDATTPVGEDENDNPEVRRWGTPRDFAAEGFEPQAHWDLGPALNIIDFERGVKLAESRFYVLGGAGARLERALIAFMLDQHTSRGYKEWWVPALANAATLTGTGQLPKFEEDLFHTTEGLYLIPTAEVQLTNLHAGEVSRRRFVAAALLRVHPVFPRGGGQRRARHARHHPRAPVLQGRDGQDRHTRDRFRRAGIHGGRRREHPAEARPSVPRDQPVHRRHRVLRGEDLRRGSVAAQLRRLQGDLLLQLLHRFPGPSRQHQVPRPGQLQRQPLRVHPERVGLAGPHHGRRHRELPESRRYHHGARGASFPIWAVKTVIGPEEV